jgi:hypothetical protein
MLMIIMIFVVVLVIVLSCCKDSTSIAHQEATKPLSSGNETIDWISDQVGVDLVDRTDR